ncbi:MAG: hypothetical protein P8107_01650, partial [Spirochaetia bacterium]
IDYIIKINESLSDFGLDSTAEKTSPQKIFSRTRKRVPLVEMGLDLDEYFTQYSHSADDKVSIQAFGRLLKKMKSVCSCVLDKKGNTYALSFSIGLDDESKTDFSFPINSLFAADFLEQRKIVVIRHALSDINIFDDKLSMQDKKYVKHSIFFPVKYNDNPAYLFIGLTGRKEKDIIEIMQDINVQIEREA